MKTLGRRIMSIILTVALILGELSLGSEPMHAEAASSLPIVNEADVTARIKELAVKLGLDGNLNESMGVIFTVNRQGCTHASNKAQENECTNCKNGYVIQADWFRETFGYTLNVSNLPGHYTPTGSMSSSGWTCVGFANFALWYIAKEDSTSDVYRDLLGTQGQAFTKANLVNSGIRIGDVIRVDGYGHSMMFLSYDGDSKIKVLDCNWTGSGTYPVGIVRIHSLDLNSSYKMAITRARNYQPDSAGTGTVPSPSITLPAAMTSSSSAEAKANIISYATSLVGWNRSTFASAGCSDIPSGDWCTWFLKLCGNQVGIGGLFSSSTDVSGFCSDMIQNYGVQAYYYADSSYLTSADQTVLSGAQAVTKSTFTPQAGDIYILHESGFSGLSQVGFVADVVNGSVFAVVGNNGTAQEVQLRNSTSNTFYQINNAACPIVGYIRPNYASLDGHVCSGTLVQANAATCTTAGNIAYYICSCGKWYQDSACTVWITNANDVVIPAYGHNWTAATCTAPQTCVICGTTTGEATDHNWTAATCTEPQTCVTCKATIGSALGHDYSGTPQYVDYMQHVSYCTRGCGQQIKESHTDIDDDFTCDTCKGNTLDPAKEGLHVELQNPNEQYVYTGSEIKPAIIVTNNGRVLTAGVDYTVKYSNNTRASLTAAEKSKPRITVTGKGNLSGSNYTTFDIQPKNIGDSDVVAGSLSVVEGTKAVPVLTHNGRKLTAADYTVEDAQKKYTENGELKINGKGNYTGSLSIPVKVVEKTALRKFNVTVGPEKLIYNGRPQAVSFTVTDASTKAILTENKDYQVVYPTGMTNAGTVKFSVIGVGDYTGTVTKSYKINPLAVKSGMQVTGVNPAGYPYNSKGVTIGGDLTVTYNNGTGSAILTEGKDYRITYSNNKKVSTSKSSAQYTITFIGNYKGSSALKGSFSIYSSGLTDATPGLKISVADQTYTGKAGTYKSEPYITVGGIKLSQSSYTVTYYRDADMTQEIKGSANKITLQEDEAFATVYVKITGKGNYAPAAGTTGYATASYKVCNKSVYKDLSKARVTFWDESGKKITKVEYTGREIKPIVKVEIKEGKNYVEVPSDQYKVTYMSNVNKGKAKVIVTGTGNSYGGSKTATFQIVAKNIKTLQDLLKGLFSL